MSKFFLVGIGACLFLLTGRLWAPTVLVGFTIAIYYPSGISFSSQFGFLFSFIVLAYTKSYVGIKCIHPRSFLKACNSKLCYSGPK